MGNAPAHHSKSAVVLYSPSGTTPDPLGGLLLAQKYCGKFTVQLHEHDPASSRSWYRNVDQEPVRLYH